MQGPTAHDILATYYENDPDYWEHEFSLGQMVGSCKIPDKIPGKMSDKMTCTSITSIASSVSNHPDLLFSARIMPNSGVVDIYRNGNISSGSSHPLVPSFIPSPSPKKLGVAERQDEYVGRVSNVVSGYYMTSVVEGTPRTQDAALEHMDTLAGNEDKTVLTVICKRATLSTPADGEDDKAADLAAKVINHRRKPKKSK